jgi:hypothetical protein
MHAPGKKPALVTDDQIVEAIVEALKPWQLRQWAGWLKLEDMSEAEVLTTIKNGIHRDIARLREVVPKYLSREAIRKTRNDAREIIKSIDKLTQRLTAKTLSPSLQMHISIVEQPGPPDPTGPLADLAGNPAPRLLDALKKVRKVCKAADKTQPLADQVKASCASLAWRYVMQFSLERPTAGSEDTKYCRIAGLLYESVSGKEHSLRHICQDVLVLRRRDDDDPWEPV